MKKKIYKVIFAMLASASLLLSSCNMFDEDSDDSPSQACKTRITVSVAGGSARTALPTVGSDDSQIPLSEFNSWILLGTKGSEYLGGESDGLTWSSYTEMTRDEIGLTAGEWTFTLTAKIVQGSGSNSKVYAAYSGSLVKTIESGTTPLSFELSLTDLLLTDTTPGNLEIKFILDDSVPDFDNKTASQKVGYAEGALYSIGNEGTVSENPASGFEALDSSTSGTFVYSKTSVPSGAYFAEFKFYTDSTKNVPVATWRDAVNINRYGAKDEITLTADDFEKTYSITYLQRLDFETKTGSTLPEVSEFEGTNTNIISYSRRTDLNLSDASKDGYTFYRWVEMYPFAVSSEDNTSTVYKWITIAKDGTKTAVESTSANRRYSIEKNTIGNRYFCAEFISEKAAKQIDSVTLYDGKFDNSSSTTNIPDFDSDKLVSVTQNAGSVKVGHTLTARATYTDGSSQTDFDAAVTWLWYVDGELVKENLEFVWDKTDSTVTSPLQTGESPDGLSANQIVVFAAWLGKTITVKAVQDYIVTMSGTTIDAVVENGDAYKAGHTYTAIGGNTSSDYSYSVAEGTLAVNDDVQLSTGDLVSLIGTAVDSTALRFSSGALIDAASLWNIATDSDKTRVTLTALSAIPESTAESPLLAPATSGSNNIAVKFVVPGYEPLYATISGVNLTVQAKRPHAADITFKKANAVKRNTICFTNTNTTTDLTNADLLDDETETAIGLGVNRTDGEKDLEYSFDGTTWNTWSTDEIPAVNSNNETYSSVYVRVAATGTSGNSGYIKESEPISVPLSDHIGSLCRLKKVEFIYDTPSHTMDSSRNPALLPELGTEISVGIIGEFENEEPTVDQYARGSYYGYSYDWKILNADGTLISEFRTAIDTDSTGENPVVEQAYPTLNLSDPSWVGKTLSVTVTPVYAGVSNDDTVEPLADAVLTASAVIQKGQLRFTRGGGLAGASSDPIDGLENINLYYGTKKTIDNFDVYKEYKELPGATPDVSKILNIYVDSTASEEEYKYIVIPNEGENWLINESSVPVTFSFGENPVVRPDNNKDDYAENGIYAGATVGSKAPLVVYIEAAGYWPETVDFVIPVDTDYAARLLSTDTAKIPAGHVMFNAEAISSGLQYLKAGITESAATDSDWITVSSSTTPMNKAGVFNETTDGNGNIVNTGRDSTSNAVNAKFFSADDPIVARYASDPSTTFTIVIEDKYIGKHGAILSMRIEESAPEITIVGNTVTAPGGSDYIWSVSPTGGLTLKNSENAEVSLGTTTNAKTVTLTVDYTGTYVIKVRYKNSLGDFVDASATVTFTAN